MADVRRAEKRKQEIKLRLAQERLELNRAEAGHLLAMAQAERERGDFPAAARDAKKALVLSPDLPEALDLLGQMYFEGGHYTESLWYFTQLRKQSSDPAIMFDVAQVLARLGRKQEALKEYQAVLQALALLKGPRVRGLKADTLAAKARLELEITVAKPGAESPAPAVVAATLPKPAEKLPLAEPEIPRVRVEFLPAAPPVLQNQPTGSLTDYFLRRRFLELRMAQNFEDLLCLGSLNGVDTYSYQHDTVRKVLRHFKGRALLADEVGLGKTIEACLVLKEYWTRGMVRKVLVLTPPSLVSQWKGELVEKFGLAPASPDGPDFRAGPAKFWTSESLIVASLGMARLEPHASILAGIAWDMVIVDEAHCLKNRTSANWKLINSLTKKFILMLSATPVENSLMELFNLITVLKPGLLSTEAEFKKQFVTAGKPRSPKNPERLRSLLSDVMIRNTRSVADVRLPHRIASSIVVAPSPDEAEVYDRISGLVSSLHKSNTGPPMALSSLLRQAGSSPHALCRSLGRAMREETWAGPKEKRALGEIQDIASRLSGSRKGDQLGDMLASHAGKTVVFTEFVPTLDHLAEICQRRSIPYARFSGDLSRPEKDAAITRFRDDVAVLLSTGSGGEGRNLQFANTVVNFDLPWSPMRLEQRVGRVHRIGQTREVFVFNFCQEGTIEEQLLRVLHDKINMFELVVGEMDAILDSFNGNLEENREFAGVVLDLWASHDHDEGRVRAFDELGERLLAAKAQYLDTRKLGESLFERDFEV
ncbi:MAG: SNF2-related protein [Bryobacteraceae bacterium]